MTLLLGQWQAAYFREAFGLRETKLELIPIKIRNGALSRNRWYYQLLPEVSAHLKADVVHLSFPVPIDRRKFERPVVCSLHDMYPYDALRNFGYARVLFNRAFLRRCLTESDAVVCSSDFTLHRVKQRLPNMLGNKVTRIYQSVGHLGHNECTPSDSDLRHQPFLLAVAQHRRNKNLDLLLEAFAELRRRSRSSRLRLLLVGAPGPETGRLRDLVQQHRLQQHVVFGSNLLDGELSWLYRRCELMIVPSGVEGFCFPLVEALQCGSRVLCSDIPVLREVGGTQCSYFPLESRDPKSELAAAIERALLQPLPLPQVDDRFSPVEIARQYTSLYSSLPSDHQAAALRRQLENAFDQRAS